MSLIAPFKTGLNTDIEPWLAPEDSFEEIDNVHIRHGYLQKRAGFRPFGALVPMGATVNISGITQASPGEVTTAVHGYSTGDQVYLTGITGMTSLNNKIFTIIVTAATTFTIGINTTALSAYTGGPGTSAVTAIATDRVMGITRYIESSGAKTTLAFNANRAYRYNSATNAFVQLDVANIASGGEYDFIWSANWQSGEGSTTTNRLYFTNGKAGTPIGAATSDGIRFYDGTADNTITTIFNPDLSPAAVTRRTLDGAKLIFSLGQRLLVLHTYEYNDGPKTTTTYPQRARWCAKANPDNWNDVTAGGGGFTDAATGDQIISARALQNQIIVFFTNSVWSLTPTPDPNRAFKWQKINTFRACDGKMATIGYDRYILAYGVRGITATDGVETRRIDQGITDFSVDEINVDEFQKVFCERSYANTRTWTLYNDVATTDNENNKSLIQDDDSKGFSTYTINMNCLGYGNFAEDFGLDDFTIANDLDLSLEDFGDETMFSYFWMDNQETLLGGDLDGNVYVLETDGDDDGLDISSTFTTAAWNPFKDQGKESQLNYIDFYVDTDLRTTALIEFYKDTDTTPYTLQTFDFMPNLGFISTIIGATTANPVNVNSPAHGRTTGDKIYMYGVNGMTQINSGETSDEYTVTVVDENNFTLDGIDGTSFFVYTGGGSIYLRKFYKTKTWKRVYGGGIGFQHRIRFTSSGIDRNFRIHGFRPSFKVRGKREIN